MLLEKINGEVQRTARTNKMILMKSMERKYVQTAFETLPGWSEKFPIST